MIIKCTDFDRQALASIHFNPKDLEDDGTNYEGKQVEKPWGYETEIYRDEHICGWLLHIRAGQQTSMHCHPNKTTMLIIRSGAAQVHSLMVTHLLDIGDMLFIEKGAFHRTEAIGGWDLLIYELETPPNKRDLVRLEDKYGRGQGYEHVA